MDEIVSNAVERYLAQGADAAVPVEAPDASRAGALDVYGQEVVEYAAESGLEEHAARTLDLIRMHFPTGSIVDVRPASDPEAGDDWLSVQLGFVGTTDAFLAAYRRYLDEFAKTVPWPAGSKLRLSYWIEQA